MTPVPVAGTFTPPGAGAHRAITFLSDGTNLREIAQTAVDVPNEVGYAPLRSSLIR